MSEQTPPELDPTIAEYYHRAPEEYRLEQGPFLLEELRTREVIERHARRPPAKVLDGGGAAGAYALWLVDAGYTVHLVDPVQRLVAEAQRRSVARSQPLASCRVGEARALDFPDQSADIVLLLGPLYHLTEATDRARALSEARRVLKPGGQLFAAAISRWASALDGLARNLLRIRGLLPSLSKTSGRANIGTQPSGSTTSPQRTFIGRMSFLLKCWARV